MTRTGREGGKSRTPDDVINGATNLLKEVFGPEAGRHARTALGMGQLPLGISVEVEG